MVSLSGGCLLIDDRAGCCMEEVNICIWFKQHFIHISSSQDGAHFVSSISNLYEYGRKAKPLLFTVSSPASQIDGNVLQQEYRHRKCCLERFVIKLDMLLQCKLPITIRHLINCISKIKILLVNSFCFILLFLKL